MELSDDDLAQVDRLPPLTNYLGPFSIKEVTTPLPLHEQERLANTLLRRIVQRQREEDEKYALPEHLDAMKRFFDPPTKLSSARLPLVSALSPRTKAKIAQLPRPNDFELSEARAIEKSVQAAGAQAIYESISRAHPATTAVDVSAPRFILSVPPDANLSLSSPGSAKYKPAQTNQERGKQESKRNDAELENLLIPKFVDTQRLAKNESTQYFDTVERNKRRRAEQQQQIEQLFSPPRSNTAQSLQNDRKRNKKAPRGEREADLSSSSLHSKTLPSLASAGKRPLLTAVAVPPSSSSSLVRFQDNPLLAPPQRREANKPSQQREADFLNAFSAKVKDEMDVDLNAAYNRNRHFRRNLQVLLLQFYRCALRSAIQQWVKVTAYLRVKEQKIALQKIINFFHRGRYYRNKRHKEFLLQQQQEAERKRFEENQRFLAQQAQIIARYVRRAGKLLTIRKLLRRRRAAMTIQRRVRGMIARRIHAEKKQRYLHRLHSVILIQRQYRRRLAARKVAVLRKLNFVHNWLASLEAKQSLCRQFFLEHGAEFYIARTYRAYVLRVRLQKMLFWSRFDKVMLIQRIFRGYYARLRVRALRREKHDREQREDEAVKVIQCAFRAHHARCRVIALFEARAQREEERYRRKLQLLKKKKDWWLRARNRWIRFRTHYLTAAVIERMKYYHTHATTIQRVYRGHHGRVRVFFVRAKQAWDRYLLYTKRRREAAVLIQRRVRGMQSRERLRRKREHAAALCIQCAFRIALSLRETKQRRKLNANARRLTRMLRRMLVRGKFLVRYRRIQILSAVAMKLQMFFRRCLARRRVWLRQLSVRRRDNEKLLVIKTKVVHLLSGIQLKILEETINKPIAQRFYTVSRRDCLCFAPLQAIFVYAVCGYAANVSGPGGGDPYRIEDKLLPAMKADNSSLVKFFGRLEDFMLTNARSKQVTINNNNNNNNKSSLVSGEYRNGVYEFVGSAEKERNYLLHRYAFANLSFSSTAISSLSLKGKLNPVKNKRENGVSNKNKSTQSISPLRPKSVTSTFKANQTRRTKNNNSKNKSKSPTRDRSAGEGEAEREMEKDTALRLTLTNGDISLPAIQRRISALEIDLVFNRARRAINAKSNANKLDYAEFLFVLDMLAALHYEDKEEKAKEEESEDEGSTKRETEGENTSTEDIKSKAEGEEERERESGEEHKMEHEEEAEPTAIDRKTPFDLQKFADELIRSINRSQFINRFNLSLPLDAFLSLPLNRCPLSILPSVSTPNAVANAGTEEKNVPPALPAVDYKPALLLRMLHSLRREEFVSRILRWLEEESLARLALFVMRIQTLFRCCLAKKRTIAMRIAFIERERLRRIAERVTEIQRIIRGFISRIRVRKHAQRTLRKFVSASHEPYWYNPITRVRKTEKPKVLGRYEAFTVALPEAGLEYVVQCVQCALSVADVYCEQCEDSFCKLCFSSLHCKGERLKHTAVTIPMCSYCQFQMATKSCVTCVVARKFTPSTTCAPCSNEKDKNNKSGSNGSNKINSSSSSTAAPDEDALRASLPFYLRGTYCDSCFLFSHDAFTQQLSRDAQTRSQYTRLLATTKQAYLLKNYVHRRIATRHQYESLTQCCEECDALTASWRCFQCEQVYCHKCLLSLHSVNVHFASHTIEPLPYYTPQMHISLCRDLAKQRFATRWAQCTQIARAQRQQLELRQIVRIQAWWRCIFYGRVGRKIMKRRRLRLRSQYRQRKREEPLRQSLTYRLKDVLGYAPRLHSDNCEESVLKPLPLLLRERAREYISKNLDDWGYYRDDDNDDSLEDESSPVLRKKELFRRRKGVPKSGFAVGEEEDLQEQARRGGERLPGRVFPTFGSQLLRTDCDLRRFLRRGEMVRVRGRYFGVVSVAVDSVKVNRRWRVWTESELKERDGEPDTEGDDAKYATKRSKRKKKEIEKAKRRKKREQEKARKKMQEDADAAAAAAMATAESHEENENVMGDDDAHNIDQEEGGNALHKEKGKTEERESEEDEEDEEDEEGELIYRVPCYKNETGRWYHWWQYKQYDILYENPFTQLSLQVYSAYSLRTMRFALALMKKEKRVRRAEEAQRWKEAAMEASENAKWAQSMLSTGSAVVDISQIERKPDSERTMRLRKNNKSSAQKSRETFQLENDRGKIGRDTHCQRRTHKIEQEDAEIEGDEEFDPEIEEAELPSRRKPLVSTSRPASGSAAVVPVIMEEEEDEGEEERGAQTRQKSQKENSIGSMPKKYIQKNEAESKKNRPKSGLSRPSSSNANFTSSKERPSSASSKKNLFSAAAKQSREREKHEQKDKTDNDAPAPSVSKKMFSLSLKGKQEEEVEKEPPKIAEKKLKNPKKKKMKHIEPWFASEEQVAGRRERESQMDPKELAAEAVDWEECIDPMTENVYWVNAITKEKVNSLPKAIQTKRQLEFEESRNKKTFDEAVKRIQLIETTTKNRMLLSGARKR